MLCIALSSVILAGLSKLLKNKNIGASRASY